MKQEQLTKLAEWYWDGKNIFDLPQITDMYLPSECNDIRVELDMKNVITFDPCEDSNQLDMLWNKFIDELGETNPSLLIQFLVTKPVGEGLTTQKYVSIEITDGYNKRVFKSSAIKSNDFFKEARLNAILNYIEHK